MLSRKKQLAAKVESTKGTKETLADADANILCDEISVSFSPEEVVRDPLRSSISPLVSLPGAKIGTITCRVELKGSGTATTAPSWGKLLRACGFEETTDADSVYYTPTSDEDSIPTLTIGVNNDGRLDLIYGARGNVSFEFAANQVAYATFTFTGIFDDTTDSSMWSPTYESTIPVTWKNASISFNFGASWTTAVVSALTIDMNNEVTIRQDANAANGLSYAIITARDPGGTIDPDKVLVATQDWISHITTPTTGTFSFDLGTSTGNKLSFSAPKFQVIGREDGDRDGVAVDTITFKLRADSGDDELMIDHV